MKPDPDRRLPKPRRRGGFVKWLLLLALLSGGGYGAYFFWPGGKRDENQQITAAVTRGNLSISVTERGELESSKSVDVACEVEGQQIKIVEIVPEGTQVKKDQVVLKFDTEALTKAYAEQEVKWKTADGKAKAAKEEVEIQKSKAEGDNAKAEIDWKLAKLDLKKYTDGEYEVELNKRKGAVEKDRRDLDEAKQKLGELKNLMKKGFATLEQVRVQEGSVKNSEFQLSSDAGNLLVLEKFERERKVVEFEAKAKDAERNMERTKASGRAAVTKAQSDYEGSTITESLEKKTLERFKAQLDKCIVKAPQDGILVYSKSRYWDPSSRIQAGGMVYFHQPVFSLPDLTQMQIKMKIHESMVKKVSKGQKCEIRVESLPGHVLHGTVRNVATMAHSEGYWDERGVKEYVTIVNINDLPSDAGLLPGMTGEVKVFVNELPNVLMTPVQAVSERDGQHYAYVAGKNGVERREVVVGENNEKFVEIKEGVQEDERVCLDARTRLVAETKAENEAAGADAKKEGKKEEKKDVKKEPAVAAPAASPVAAPNK